MWNYRAARPAQPGVTRTEWRVGVRRAGGQAWAGEGARTTPAPTHPPALTNPPPFPHVGQVLALRVGRVHRVVGAGARNAQQGEAHAGVRRRGAQHRQEGPALGDRARAGARHLWRSGG